MHLSEFQAWFEGYTEEMTGTPSKTQWAKIKKRVKEITADYTPAPIFIEKYVRPWRQYWETDRLYGPWVKSLTYGTSALQLSDWTAAGRAECCAES